MGFSVPSSPASPASPSTPSFTPPAENSSGPLVGPERPLGLSPSSVAVAGIVLVAIAVLAAWLHHAPDRGSAASFSLLTGAAFGIILQRGRFCFFCIFRDLIEERDASGFYSVLSALAVGGLSYAVVFGAFLPHPSPGRLPPDAHIGPVSWALVVAGIVFGIGMALSGACISGHLYRLGEGYSRAPLALIGSIIGFGLGFLSWRTLYVSTISKAPLPWLPHYVGYGGALLLHLTVIGILGLVLFRLLPPKNEKTHRPQPIQTLASLWNMIFHDRWPAGITGAAVGVLGAFAYLRVSPLGVTSQLGSIARTFMTDAGLLEGRLNGLDTFAGCITLVIHTISNNGLLILGLVAASFAVALLGKNVSLSSITVRNAATALLGGIMMGWGSMIALGCTVGTLLSGIMAFSLSGWVFFAAVFAGVWLGIKLRLHQT